MTLDASFGPVFTTTALYFFSRPVNLYEILSVIKKHSLVLKKCKEQKKVLTYGPNDASGVVWASLVVAGSPNPPVEGGSRLVVKVVVMVVVVVLVVVEWGDGGG
jgi:uncharacterized protein YciI